MRNRTESLARTSVIRPCAPSAALLFILLAGFSSVAAASDARWVQGSWVNVRSTASAEGAVVARLTANTPIMLIARQGEWCEISAKSPEAHGFMACRLLGDQPLSLADIGGSTLADGRPNPAYSPTRAFWLAPSVSRLLAAGNFFWSTMLNEAQRKKENPMENQDPNGTEAPFNWEQKQEPVRFPIAEFEAMKTLLQNGVVAAEELRPASLRWSDLKKVAADKRDESFNFSRLWIDGGTLTLMHQGQLNPVKPSYFKRVEELAPAGVSVEQLSAQFGIRERMRVLTGPQWVWPRNENPVVAGSWDIGSYEIALDKPVIEYVVGRQGLAAAMEWEARQTVDIGAENGCDAGFSLVQRAKQRLPEYPHVKDPLIWFYTTKAPPFKQVKIKTYAKRLDAQPNRDGSGQGDGLSLLVMHEIDLDGDGVVDLMAWEGMGRMFDAGPESEDTVTLRMAFANIAGEWYLLNIDTLTECT